MNKKNSASSTSPAASSEASAPLQSLEEAKHSFESALGQLEQAVELLESGNLELETAIKAFEEGMQWSALCRKKLDQAEQRVEILLKQASGQFKKESFNPPDAVDQATNLLDSTDSQGE